MMANTFFAPELYVEKGTFDISFYERAFSATENLCFKNDDGSIHVAELSIDGAIFHIHEVMSDDYFSPTRHDGCTCCIGLFVDDVHAVMKQAVNAGAIEIAPATDHDYGYRQGMIKDPFGHFWQIQKKI
jgi:PhnB protein